MWRATSSQSAVDQRLGLGWLMAFVARGAKILEEREPADGGIYQLVEVIICASLPHPNSATAFWFRGRDQAR